MTTDKLLKNREVQDWGIFLLRVLIGWHFLYEGLAKFWDPDWSAAGYLEVSRWWFADFFHWIAFKILAAGAIRPSDGFHYAFSHGADFACVGMYDFQMVKNVNTAADVLASDIKRTRPWCSETILA